VRIDQGTLACACPFALLGLLGPVSLVIQPRIGVVLIRAPGGVACTLPPWES
jgi:hypothetical protein